MSGFPCQLASNGDPPPWVALPFLGTPATCKCSPSPWLSPPQSGGHVSFLPHQPPRLSLFTPNSTSSRQAQSCQIWPSPDLPLPGWAGVSAPRPQSPFPAKPCSPIKPRTQSYPGALAGLGTSSCSWDAPRAACPSRGVGFPLAFSEPAHVGAGLQNLCEGRRGRGEAGRGEAGRALGLAPWALRRSTCCPVLPSRTKAPTEHAAREFRGEGGPSHVPVACGPLCSLTPDAAAVRGTSRPQHPKVHGGPAL